MASPIHAPQNLYAIFSLTCIFMTEVGNFRTMATETGSHNGAPRCSTRFQLSARRPSWVVHTKLNGKSLEKKLSLLGRDGPGSRQMAYLRWWFFPVHRWLGEATPLPQYQFLELLISTLSRLPGLRWWELGGTVGLRCLLPGDLVRCLPSPIWRARQVRTNTSRFVTSCLYKYYAIYEMYDNLFWKCGTCSTGFSSSTRITWFEIGLTYLGVGFTFNPSFNCITRNRLLIYLHQETRRLWMLTHFEWYR